MDTVGWEESRYKEIKEEMSRVLVENKQMAWNLDEVEFIPVSGLEGDNLKDKSDKMPWYTGPTILQAFDSLKVPEKPTSKPLRLPIQDVYSIQGIGTVPSGRVETGVMKPGDKVVFTPSGKTTVVNTIQMHYEEIPMAEPGDNVGFAKESQMKLKEEK